MQRKITEALYIQELKPDLNAEYEQLNILNFIDRLVTNLE